MNAFLSYLSSGVATGCGFALLASGLVVVQRVTRVVNLSQGMPSVAAALTASSLLASGVPHGVAELAAVLVAASAGFATGLIAVGRRATTPLSSLIITFAVSIFAYAVEILVWGDQPRSFAGVPGAFETGGVRILDQDILVVLITAVVFVALELLLERTYLGKALTACSSNPYAARIAGIDTRRMGLLAFAIAGALGGFAGVLLGPLRPTSFDSDVPLVIDGFAAAVLGGMSRPALAFGGGLVLGVAQAMTAGYAGGSYQTEVALALILTILVARSFGSRSLGREAT